MRASASIDEPQMRRVNEVRFQIISDAFQRELKIKLLKVWRPDFERFS